MTYQVEIRKDRKMAVQRLIYLNFIVVPIKRLISLNFFIPRAFEILISFIKNTWLKVSACDKSQPSFGRPRKRLEKAYSTLGYPCAKRTSPMGVNLS